ncbi:MAG: hypothetical protein R2882_03865 [Gemmatimonadales bacterium]
MMVARPAAAQWNDPAALALARRAASGRQAAALDSTLRSYAADARGVVTFVTEFGADGPLRRVVKGDELRLEVYWERPDRSKQVIVAWRDSTFLPTDLAYHRDHLGLVSDDAGSRIRIGNGDEIADVPHPLSADGLPDYDIRIADSLVIRTAAASVVLTALEVRPRDPGRPGVIGTFYLDRDRAAIVRSTLSFTAAAYRDPTLEDIVVRLERSLVDGRYWLPYRQDIEIRRRSAVVDFPVRGIIRARWEVDGYRFNEPMPERVRLGAAIGGRLTPGGGPFEGSLLAAVDTSVAPASAADLEAARRLAAASLRGRLGGLPPVRLGMSRVSEILRVNRVEGLRVGAGVAGRGRFGPADRAALSAGYGTANHLVTGSVSLGRAIGTAVLTLRAEREVRDAGDWPGASGLVNSLAAQEGGRDLGDYLLSERLAAEVRWAAPGRTLRVSLGRDWSRSVPVAARPVRGTYRPNPDLGSAPAWTARGEWVRRGGRPGQGTLTTSLMRRGRGGIGVVPAGCRHRRSGAPGRRGSVRVAGGGRSRRRRIA